MCLGFIFYFCAFVKAHSTHTAIVYIICTQGIDPIGGLPAILLFSSRFCKLGDYACGDATGLFIIAYHLAHVWALQA
ncbi:hypothetical protein BCR43DRAFT_491620 [Syncephalastrum racemosum]|uniref:Uncharacterized protein n=1 Tax=Syncephalastrum racemosum TaxID=13706 RepID=A0A1X2HC80_SYNRA|nr:hypothetical protein BCR43DRAFT_491620 [Syncephalastrum racemosum]